MENEGQPGELLAAGRNRLALCFQTGDRPDVLLLLEGINDVAAGNNGYAPTPSQEQTIVDTLTQDASMAASAGVSYIFVSTILPVRTCPLGSNQACRVGKIGDPDTSITANASIDQVNTLMRAQGIGGATIVDANAIFKTTDATLQSLIGLDGLHPTQTGYAVLAKAWMDAMTSKIPITSLRRLP
jgi:lysophospholipase L1-like esterase